jgi:hypothetical protein
MAVRYREYAANGHVAIKLTGTGTATSGEPDVGPGASPGMIQVQFMGTPAGLATLTRQSSAYDLETRAARTVESGFQRNVLAEVKLVAPLSRSLPAGEPMLLTTWGEPDRLELIRAKDTDWPAGRRS